MHPTNFGDFIETPENWIFLLLVLPIVLPMFYVLGLLFPITAPIIFIGHTICAKTIIKQVDISNPQKATTVPNQLLQFFDFAL